MLKILDHRPDCPAPHVDPADHSPAARAELARLMREQLAAFAEGLAQGTRRLHRPPP